LLFTLPERTGAGISLLKKNISNAYRYVFICH
jgi:hypothetical protein